MPDVVWYWVGGSVVGAWFEADAYLAGSLEKTRESIRRQGYVAHLGYRSIGKPEGAPSESDFRSVGMR